MTYDNTNKAAIFPNDKRGNAKAPDYRGTVNVAGVEYKISLWIRTTKDGRTYFQGPIELATPKDARAGDSRPSDPPRVSTPPPAPQNAGNGQQADEDVPF